MWLQWGKITFQDKMAMDVETGEYILDLETGEILTYPQFNDETGEYEGLPHEHENFKIPRAYYTPEPKPNKRKRHKFLKADYQESQLITASIYLLPTMILFHPILALVAVIIEIFLHSWSHRSNKRLKDKNVYFQSPLHPIVKEFCARCKEENSSLKITRLQDIKNDKFKNYIRRVVN
ncbi:hypothetical protein JTB14_035595 [Gonioctena quinquepunctata]|nr:hypothetical protein JTB14_035595 [Gonioctena quinquepunctata]